MTRYVARRLLIAVPLYLGVTVLVYLLITLTPGDPLAKIVGTDTMHMATPAQIERWREQYGLNQPIYVRYFTWLRNAARGELGFCTVTNMPVADEIGRRLGPTVLLMGSAFLMAAVIGIPLGIVMAVKRRSWLDYGLTLITFVNYSFPAFFLAMALVFTFAVKLRLLPVSGLRTYSEPFSVGDLLRHLLLPALVLGFFEAGVWARYMRACLVEVLAQDYVTVARSKGLKERAILWRHALRNAILPIVTLMGLSMAGFVGGAVVVETIFQWPGLGWLGYQAAIARDYATLMGILLLSAAMVLAANLVTDIAYAIVDPRITYG